MKLLRLLLGERRAAESSTPAPKIEARPASEPELSRDAIARREREKQEAERETERLARHQEEIARTARAAGWWNPGTGDVSGVELDRFGAPRRSLTERVRDMLGFGG